MRDVLKNKKIYIFAAILVVISIGTSFLISALCNWTFPYYIPLVIFSFVYGLASYISGDIMIVRYRHRVQEINPALPFEEQIKAWTARAPFIIALIVTLLVLGTFFVISLFLGKWPFIA